MKNRTVFMCAITLFATCMVSACSNQNGNNEVLKPGVQEPSASEGDTTDLSDTEGCDSLLSCEAHDFVFEGAYITLALTTQICLEDNQALIPQEHCHYSIDDCVDDQCYKHCKECKGDEKCGVHSRAHQLTCESKTCAGCLLPCTESDLAACPHGEGQHLFFKGKWCWLAFEYNNRNGMEQPIRIVIEPNESDKPREIAIPYRAPKPIDNGVASFIFRQQGRK